jgi:hypothetical protein
MQAAWSGKTIKFIADHVGPSLQQRPNIILLHAGTNDMNPDPGVSTEGNVPRDAANRLGSLIDQMIQACPDAVILVAIIMGTCAEHQRTMPEFQSLIPEIVHQRRRAGHKVDLVDFTSFPTSLLRDCIHPSADGYRTMGDYWYDSINRIPSDWISAPVGADIKREPVGDSSLNGGIDGHIPPPNWGDNPVKGSSKAAVRKAFNIAGNGGERVCKTWPAWQETGKIATGIPTGKNGEWHFHQYWVQHGQFSPGRGLDRKYVR